ncbi:17228_t:CDS:2, partial [Cetraspora pellucida]
MPKYSDYTTRHNAINNALKAIKNSPSDLAPSTRSIARDYGLPETTLRHAIKNDGPFTRPGCAKILTNHEEKQLTKGPILLMKMDQGKKWWQRFMKDHPELSFRVLQALNEAHTQRANPIIIKDHFEKLQKIIQEYSLSADRIWNMAPKSYSKERSMSGSSGKRVIPGLLNGAPVGSVMGFTETGYMRESLFQKYIEHFVSSIPPAHSVLLILNGHKSHINYPSVNYCYEHNILLYALSPHTTHILQPSELPFATLKKMYDNECEKFRVNYGGKLVTKHTFAEALGPAYITTYTPTAICNTFKSTEIWPFNPNAISPDHNLWDPSTLQVQERSALSSQSSQSSELNSGYICPIELDPTKEQLALKVELLKKKVEILEEELETFKRPSTSSLKLVLKYPLRHDLKSAKDLEVDEEQSEPRLPERKKRKTMPFSQLLINEKSLQQLKEAEEEAEKVANEKQCKKEMAAQKRIAREAEKAQKKEARKQKKDEMERIKAEKQ